MTELRDRYKGVLPEEMLKGGNPERALVEVWKRQNANDRMTQFA